ncbi:MAG: N-acetylmuramic acid 6-phosphate etherase [Gammaproteobacteria bacterium]|nr:N-acetylmuramic acid 6-phosphate etherase [Gammaproteobacteria bacterium]
MTVKFILGIDGGGTKTVGRIENIETGERFEQKAGASSLTYDFEGACVTLMQIIESLMAKAECKANEIAVVMGLAGAGNQSQVARLKRRLSMPFVFLHVYNDARTSLYGANQGKPVAMVALGTGSVGAMLDQQQQEHYVGGWGFPIGDEGGGAKLGFMTIKVLLKELDTLYKPVSQLAITLMNELGPERDDLLNWLRNASPAAYARLAKLVFKLAPSCSAARSVVQQHAKDVEELILLARKEQNIPVVLMGGLAAPTYEYLQEDIQAICDLQQGLSLEGACFLAKQLLEEPIDTSTQGSHEEENKVKIALLSQLNNMVSEERNPNTMQIDLMATEEVLSAINEEDRNVPLAIEKCITPIAKAVDIIVDAFKQGGRLIYIGAGTSGRLGILDAVECPPTFGVSSKQVVGIIAGGNQAIYKAVEGAEDDPELGKQDLIDNAFTNKDVLVGLAASGRTPYVLGALEYARSLGANTVSVACNPGSIIEQYADINICPVVGPEVLTGSTRLKSGSAQKQVLNMLTTASMIRSGKSFENLMVDVNASNKKLYARAIRIVMQATNCDRIVAEEALQKTQFKAKLAILHVLTGVEPNKGQEILAEQGGFLRRSVDVIQHQA